MTDEPVVRLGARGDGVTASGRFVPMTAPGDLLRADGSVAAGIHRVAPPCRHFPECGGCQLQHVDDGAYAGFLVDRIASALATHGIDPPDFLGPHVSPPRTRRRASLRAERRGARVWLGFNAEASHRIIDMRECHILAPALFALVEPLRAFLGRRLGPRSRAEVRLTSTDQGVDLLVAGLPIEDLESVEDITAFARAHALARFAVDDGFGAQPRWEPEPVTVTMSNVPVSLPPGAFLQATREGEEVLVESVDRAIDGAGQVVDLFAGIGTFTFALGDARVLAVEGARDAALALGAAAALVGRPVAVEHRDLFRLPLDSRELDRFEAVVIDPPRAGAKEQAAMLAASGVRRIAAVSCNPSTFARDARLLVDGGYRLEWIRPVGQFRWSTHVELVAAFGR